MSFHFISPTGIFEAAYFLLSWTHPNPSYKVIFRYYVKYMTKDDFENFWISSGWVLLLDFRPGISWAQQKPSPAFVYHDSRQREENQILPLGHFEWFRYKSPTSVRLSS